MGKKSILITGCSSGIGHDAAHTLHQRGWRVFATCRKPADCDRLSDEGLESFVLDYDDPDTIAAAMDTVLTRTGGTLDALYNNGAFGCPGAVEDLPRAALNEIFETNLFGPHDLTTRVIPVMRAQGHGRIINCSSVLGLTALGWRGAYCATKFALEAMTDTLRLELRDTPIHVILIEPGPITTNIRVNSIPHFERWVDWRASPNRAKYEAKLLKRLYEGRKNDAFELPPSAVTRKLIHALEHPRPKSRYMVTTPTYVTSILRRILPVSVSDWLLSRP